MYLVVCVVVDEIENVIDNDSNGDDQHFNQLEDERMHYCVAFFFAYLVRKWKNSNTVGMSPLFLKPSWPSRSKYGLSDA